MHKENIPIYLKSIILFIFFIALSSVIFYLPYKVVRNSTINSLNSQQRVLAKQAASGIQDFFFQYQKILTHLASQQSIIDLDVHGKTHIDELFRFNTDAISAVTRVDATGHIVYTAPYNEKAIGKDISTQEHNRLIIENNQAIVSDVFTAVQGYRTVAYAIPVFDGENYAGCLTILIPFEIISQKYLSGIILGDDGYAWMINKNGVELYCPVPGHTGRTIFETSPQFPSVIAMGREMMQGKEGSTLYTYDRIKDEHTETISKHAVYHPVRLPGNIWSIVVATPEKQALAAVRDFGKWWLAIFLVLVTGLLAFVTVFVRSRLIAKEERKRQEAEKKLRKNERLFSRFINDAHVPIIMVNVNGTIEFINTKWQQLYGYTLDDIPTTDHWFRKAYPNDKLRRYLTISWEKEIKEALKTDCVTAITPMELSVTCKDGSSKDVVFAYTLMDERVIITMLDNTEHNRLERSEQELLHKQQSTKKMEAIGLMAGGVAHDLNNILSGITSYPELILMDLPQNSELREPINEIHLAGQRAVAVVADLLTVARGVASKKEPGNINTIIKDYLDSPECRKLHSLDHEVDITTDLAPDLLLIACSTIHIRKCIMNLVTNGAEALTENGTVAISTCNEYVGESLCRELNLEKGRYAVLSIHDTGPGIAAKDREHIFEPFYTKKVMGKSGTGLGLAVVWNTVQDHGGAIALHSNESGTTFSLYFPVTKEETVAPAPVTDPENLHGNGEHILVVDDEPQQRDIATRILTSLDYSAIAVSSGEEAIQYVQTQAADLILLDMLMDPGINGRATYEEIIKMYPGQKAVIASGFSQSDDVKKAFQLGAKGFIKKPYTREQLGLTIKEELEK